MKRSSVICLASLLFAAVLLSSCGGLKKMIKRAPEVKYTINPSPLEMHNDSVEISVTVNFPEKYFHPKAIVDFTPELKFGENTLKLKTETIRGEKTTIEGGSIISKSGGTFVYTDSIAYKPEYCQFRD